MKIIIKVILLMLFINSILYSNSAFTLSGIKTVHPVVIVKTKKLPKLYKKMIAQEIRTSLDYLNINYTGDNKRLFAILVNSFEVGKSSIIDIELRICEQVKRLDSDNKTFAATYIFKEQFLLNEDGDLEDLLEDALSTILNEFTEQYEEENTTNDVVDFDGIETAGYEEPTVETNKLVKQININEENFAKQMKYETSYEEAVKKAKKLKRILCFL